MQTDGASADPFAAFSEESLAKQELLAETGLRPGEYIISEIDAHGGRLKQQDIIGYTGWSAATVSRLLSAMEDEGRIVRLRVGRENLVYLPDATPDELRSETDAARNEAETSDE